MKINSSEPLNIFQNAKPGDKFQTKGGLVAIYLSWLPSVYRAFDKDGWNHKLFVIDSCPNEPFLYKDNGTGDFENRDLDIIGPYYGMFVDKPSLDIPSFISVVNCIEDFNYDNFDKMNTIAASLSTHSSFLWRKALYYSKLVILSVCQILSDKGVVEFDNGCSIIFPKNIKSIKQITYLNRLGEDCGYPDTNCMICDLADELCKKYNIPMDCYEFTGHVFNDSLSQSKVDSFKKEINNLILE